MDLLRLTDAGLYCEPGDFYIDPWEPVPRAVVTHAHADHARTPDTARFVLLIGEPSVSSAAPAQPATAACIRSSP